MVVWQHRPLVLSLPRRPVVVMPCDSTQRLVWSAHLMGASANSHSTGHAALATLHDSTTTLLRGLGFGSAAWPSPWE